MPGIARSWLLACALVAASATSSLSEITCKPLLSVKTIREMRAASTPAQPWIWKATLVADASYCATRGGNFEIDFMRIKEYAPDAQFTEKYRWTQGEFDVSMELTADEAVHAYRIGFIAPCVCRAIPYEK